MAAAAPHREPPRDPPRDPPQAPSRRRRRPRASPNPLFTLWLREWRDEARGTWARRAYERALRSLSLFPLRLRSGRSAAILQHFGPALCERLERRLRQHRREQGLPPTPPREGRDAETLPAPPTRRPRKVRPVPCPGAQELPVVKDQVPADPPGSDPGSPIGCSPGGPAPCPAVPGAPPGGAGRELCPLPTPCDPEFQLRPGEFDIVLCADVTEANGPRGGIPALLRARGVQVLLRRLHVGDFLWVARERDPPAGHAPRELVLDVVVERKSAADLGNSLRDGRYREQKFRLRRSGLRCPIYLLEAPGEGEPLPLPLPTLRQAAANTQVVDGFFVKHTRDPQESAMYLGVLGGHLKRRFEGRVLQAWGGDVAARGPPEPPGTPCTLLSFQRLREGGGKNQAQTVGDVFARQLLQLGGLSGGRAAAILRRFPTPASLMDALGHCLDPQKFQDLLSALRCGPSQRNLGPSLSRSLVQLYRTPGPLP